MEKSFFIELYYRTVPISTVLSYFVSLLSPLRLLHILNCIFSTVQFRVPLVGFAPTENNLFVKMHTFDGKIHRTNSMQAIGQTIDKWKRKKTEITIDVKISEGEHETIAFWHCQTSKQRIVVQRRWIVNVHLNIKLSH